MATIRDLVAAIRQRDGVEAAIVLGRDGLVIDSDADAHLDAEQAAALVPGLVTAADELGAMASRGESRTVVVESERGLAIVSTVSADALLLVLVRPNANLGQLLYELRRNRANIASLV